MAKDSLKSLGVVVVAAAAGSFGGAWLAGAGAAPVVLPLAAGGANEPAAAAAAAAATSELLPRLLEELVALRAALAAVPDGRDPAAPHDQRSPGAVPGTPVPFVLDEEALLQALLRVEDRREQVRVAAMSDKELFHDAELQLRAGTMDRVRARRLLETLLQRSIDAPTRARARNMLGTVLRDLKEFELAAAAFRQVIEEFGLRDHEGARAGMDWANLALYTKDFAQAIPLADRVAREAGTEFERYEARWTAACLAMHSGDRERAIADFTRLAAECKGDREIVWIGKDSERRLEALRGR